MAKNNANATAPAVARKSAPQANPRVPKPAPLKDPPILGRSEPADWCVTPHTVALVECAQVEARSGDTIPGHMTYLSMSPMFKPLVEAYKADLLNPGDIEPDWYLTLFAARLFYAGVIAGRTENGQRTDLGDLSLDTPWISERKRKR